MLPASEVTRPAILLITVGGSYQPIVTAIRDLCPDRVLFICSDTSQSQVIGDGTPCERRHAGEIVERQLNIPTQLHWGDRFHPERDLLVLDDLDDLAACYQAIADQIRAIRRDAGGDRVRLLADYTGGTKTMSAALAMVSIDSGVSEIYVTTGRRRDLIRIEFSERVERASTSAIALNRFLTQNLPALLQQYNYPAAIAELKTLLAARDLPASDRERIHALLDCCTGFDCWDRFDHAQAWSYFEPYTLLSQSPDDPLGALYAERGQTILNALAVRHNSLFAHGLHPIDATAYDREFRAVVVPFIDAGLTAVAPDAQHRAVQFPPTLEVASCPEPSGGGDSGTGSNPIC